MTKRHTVLLLLLGAAATIASVGTGFTIAGFVGKAKINAPIGQGGIVGTYVFLDTGIWTEEADGAAFCVDCWTSGNAHSFDSSAVQTSDGYLVFNIDLDLYNGGGFQFVRYNNSTPIANLNWNNAEGMIWNVSQTFNISNRTISGASGKNLYVISGWGTEHFEDQSHHDLGTKALGDWTETLIDAE